MPFTSPPACPPKLQRRRVRGEGDREAIGGGGVSARPSFTEFADAAPPPNPLSASEARRGPAKSGARERTAGGMRVSLQLALPVHLALLPLLVLLIGVMPAVEAAGGGAEDAVMAGIVTGDA